MTREHNWCDNYTFSAPRIVQPGTIDEVRRMVASSRKIRAIGTRHSFSGIADSEGTLIDLCGLDPSFAIDEARMTVTVGANTSYGVLAAYLQSRGYALHNMGSLPHISVAGAIATGTHGSGDANGNLSTAVIGLELVLSSGDLIRVDRGTADFAGMVVGLGAFGIVTRITLDIQPSFSVRQDAFIELPWDTLLGNFDAVFSAAYSVNVLTRWNEATVNRLWLKTRLTDGQPTTVEVPHLGAIPAPPTMISSSADDPTTRLNPFGVAGPWSERLPHFRLDRTPGVQEQIQSEYMVPRSRVVEALIALRAIGARIDPVLYTTELRSMAADGLWLSPAHGHDSVGIHFTWKQLPAEVDALTHEIESLLLPLGARPHWGKLLHAPAHKLAPLYPRMDEFRALANSYDPDWKFRNTYLATHVFG